MLIVRQFQPSDMFKVIKLASTLLTEQYNPTLFTYFYETAPWGMWVCEDNHTIIGFAIGIEHTSIIGRIVMIATLPQKRRQGIGSTLLTRLLSQFSQRQLYTIELEVKTTNLPAILFYKKHHFDIIENFPHFYQNGEDAYLMKLILSPHTYD